MTNVLVTGGTGFIGSFLVKGLVNKGYKVRVFDNNYRGTNANLEEVKEKIEIVEGDIRNLQNVEIAAKGMDTVFHLAFINGTENFYKRPELVMEVGIKGHLNIMEAMEKHSVSKFIYASSSEVYQTPPYVPTDEQVQCVVPDVHNPRYSYGGSKLIGEILTLHYSTKKDLQKIIFRPHNIYGPSMGFEHVIPQLVEKMYKASAGFTKNNVEITIQGTGEETRAFCYVDDAVEGIILTAEKGLSNEIYHVGVDQEERIIDLAYQIASILNLDLTLKHEEIQKGGTPRRCPDISKLKSLGYTPQYSLESGLKKTILWYKDYFIKKGM
ncbi:MAG: NAD-dependent epimerase/dehydratase family protein [Campylobacterota bacterium]